jgi:hypothetical protein
VRTANGAPAPPSREKSPRRTPIEKHSEDKMIGRIRGACAAVSCLTLYFLFARNCPIIDALDEDDELTVAVELPADVLSYTFMKIRIFY